MGVREMGRNRQTERDGEDCCNSTATIEVVCTVQQTHTKKVEV
jgi:hypothetical protein